MPPMATTHYADRLAARVEAVQSVLCVGLDPRFPLPPGCQDGLNTDRSGLGRAVERYCVAIIDAVAPFAAAIKPQVAWFEALGGYGLTALERVCRAAGEAGLIVIADAKRGDIPATAEAYAQAWIGRRRNGEAPMADAVTVNPYLGRDSLAPFAALSSDGRGCYVLVRTSNPGADDLQTLTLREGGRVWERVAMMVNEAGAGLIGACGLAAVGGVVGLTDPDAVVTARRLMPAAPLLLPGLGAQAGQASAAAAAFAPHPAGGLVSASRSVIEAWRATPGEWREHVAAAAQTHRDTLWRMVDAVR
jgi:orotidine-5'-phosphate decarboxylase